MAKIIVFDETCPDWGGSIKVCRAVAGYKVVHLLDLLEARGYLYLNQIYEEFGVLWDPAIENTMWEWDALNPIRYEIETDESSNKIYIYIH